ncbi:MAG: C40 family peptidase [Prolixibacteraceae bacterium]|nr:C40 family peptidase [Prolixibacteraceae bacterium]
MQHGISNLSLIPVRREPSERSEMVTQILFGEHFEIRDETDMWSYVKLGFDGYEGWIDRNMISFVDDNFIRETENRPYAVCGDLISSISLTYDQDLMMPAGSTLPLWRPQLREFTINGRSFKFSGNVYYGKTKNPREIIIKQAFKYLNVPYLWGGRTPFGIDCSGFSQILYKMAGIYIPRDAGEQVRLGNVLQSAEDSEPGDLAFFENDQGNIVHVGIIWQKSKIIHAHGKVRVDNLDQSGIYNVDLKRYTHKLRVIKNIILDDETN